MAEIQIVEVIKGRSNHLNHHVFLEDGDKMLNIDVVSENELRLNLSEMDDYDGWIVKSSIEISTDDFFEVINGVKFLVNKIKNSTP